MCTQETLWRKPLLETDCTSSCGASVTFVIVPCNCASVASGSGIALTSHERTCTAVDNENLFLCLILVPRASPFMNKRTYKEGTYQSPGLRKTHLFWDSHRKVVGRIEQGSPWKTSKPGTKRKTSTCPLECLVTTELFAGCTEDVLGLVSHPQGSNYVDFLLPQTPDIPEKWDWGKKNPTKISPDDSCYGN